MNEKQVTYIYVIRGYQVKILAK